METTLSLPRTYRKTQIAFYVLIIILLLLWVPVLIDKLTGFDAFRSGILNQPFSDELGNIVIYTLPVAERAIVLCLVSAKLQKTGLLLSTGLMTVFTGYIGMALLGTWEKLPCGCGSVISGMTWMQHFFFNLFFLIVSVGALYLWYKLRGSNAGSGSTEGGSAKRQHN